MLLLWRRGLTAFSSRMVSILLILTMPTGAFALDMEYHCYNGFDPIVTAFQKVALIFGANDYRGLFFSMAVAVVLFGGMFVYLKVFMGGRLSLGAWVTPFFLGVILYLGLMVPTGNLTIQDDVLNRFQIVQGVPDGIVALAGVTNLIERSVIEIIDLVAAPNAPTYKESAGGIGFDLLMAATGGSVSAKTPDAYMTASLDRYLIMQAVLSNMINDAILYADPDTAARALANRNQVATGLGLGLMAGEWLPVARAVITAIAVGLVPFVVLLIPTPLSGRALQLLTGFFIWLTAWGVTDAIVNSFALSQAFNLFDTIRSHNFGMVSLMLFPTAAMKAYAMFGMIRTAGIGLATVMTAMLIRFGGAALASLAGSITASIQSQGGAAGRSLGTPEGIAREIRETNLDVPVMANALAYDWTGRTVSQGNQLDHGLGSGLGWGSGSNALATGFGSTAVASSVQKQKIADSGGFREWVQNEAVTGGMAVMSGAGKRVTWDSGMNEFRNDYLRENPTASAQEVRMSGSQFFGSFLNPEKGLEEYRALKDKGVPPSGSFDEMVRLGAFGTEKGYAFTEAQIETVRRYANQHGMTPSQALHTWGEFDVANAAAMMEAFKTPESYENFRTMAYILDAAQQRGIMEAARHAGYDPSDTVQTASFLKHLETIGALQMYKEVRLNDEDLLLIGSARVLSEKGLAHARENISRITGMGIDKVEEYMRTREGLLNYARFDNMEQFARRHGQSFMELARDSQRSINLDLDGKTAALWGLPGTGHYAVSWGGKGGYVFTDRKSGSQYQVGVFGHSGRSEFVHDEKGTVIFHGSNATYGDREERRSFAGSIGGYDFEKATYERTGDMVTVTGRLKDGGMISLTAKTGLDRKGIRQYEVESVVDRSGVRYSKESAVSAVQRGKVRGDVFTDAQAREAFAESFVAALQSTREVKAVYYRGFGLDSGTNISPMSGGAVAADGPIAWAKGKVAATLGVKSSHGSNEWQTIEEQKVKVLKVIEESKGNGFLAAERLRRMWADNTGDSSFRMLNFYDGGAPNPGYIEKARPQRFEPSSRVVGGK